MIKEAVTIEMIKRKYNALSDKKAFRQEIADLLGKSLDYITMNWFQKDWKIPLEHFTLINDMLDKKISDHIVDLQSLKSHL